MSEGVGVSETMSHSEQRGTAQREAMLALFTGSIYGGVHTITGHPLDTVKSRMQLDPNLSKASAMQVVGTMWRQEGVRGFFRGCVPPLWGSMVYRGLMMSGYEFSFTYIEKEFSSDSFLRQDISVAFPVRPICLVSGLFAALCRGFIESPIEYAKVMGQLGKRWRFKDIYRGLSAQMIRTAFLITPIFAAMDTARRKTTLMTSLPGNFAVATTSCGIAYLMCWPLETMKNLAQSGIPHPSASVAQRVAHLGGWRGVYRGVWPGCSAGALRNGCGMVAMQYAQKWATLLGLRE